MTVTEALYAKRADYDGGACVIVATLQTFRREDKDGLKVYAPNGELMDHFSGLPDRLRHGLEKGHRRASPFHRSRTSFACGGRW